jgi:hypothetical protein
VNFPLKAFLRASLIALVLLSATVARPHAASAATPCWKVLLTDWYDGRIDGTYPIHCYKDALRHLPSDVSTYSSARDDILRALQSAVAKQKKAGQSVGANTLVPPSGHKKTSKTSTTKDKAVTAADTRGRKTDKGLGGVAERLNPSSPSSLPVPLLVLGGLGILLIGAGGVGLAVKRIQARRPGT